MSTGSPGPRAGHQSGNVRGDSESADPDSGGVPGSAETGSAETGKADLSESGAGAPGTPATEPDERGPDSSSPSGRATAEARSSGKALHAPRRARRPRRGRPRSTHADRRILDAAAEVMAEKGINGLTIEEVAVRAGVGKTTIYRRWSSRGTLALDAFLAEFEWQQGLPNTGTFAGDLRAAIGAWAKAVSGTNAGTMLVGLITEIQHDRALADAWRDQVIAPLRAQYSIMLDRGVTRGEIPAETDAGVVLDLLFGACYYRLLQRQRPLNDQFVYQVVDIVAAGVGARTNLACSQRGRGAGRTFRN
ncbi:MAG TPA: TetR/AcrR family transcriptional regulator C-terminal ligand-binding domain-containing protein [Streptosporangiaceae bacterium]|nr:TetR/AcrR family transcriptional regulator C-terminal ligand-binding domain-containing protein [Streptosporangiaceae bacterium]